MAIFPLQSTIPGYVSFRNVGEGSYFIQILARELEQHGTADTVLDLFTHTIRVVSEVKGDMIPIFRVSESHNFFRRY